MDIKKKTISNLKRHEVGSSSSEGPLGPGLGPSLGPRASILIPLFVKHGQLHVWMTLRSEQLRSGAGEVCFPGGSSDPDEDEVDTALREAEEEIGLAADQVEVVCRLGQSYTINQKGLVVTPVVGFVDESFRPCPNPDEVSAAFSVPLEFFTQKKDHSVYNKPGTQSQFHSFQFLDPDTGCQYWIWGLTAFFAILTAVYALEKLPEFDIRMKKPWRSVGDSSEHGPNSKL